MAPRRHKKGHLIFKNHPEFTPNLTPKEIFAQGAFGGTYWRPIYSTVTKKKYKDPHLEFPKSWWRGLSDEYLTSEVCNKDINKYNVKSGTSLKYWESKGWIHKQDPYGWIQWYCRFYHGRRSSDDERQIKRWLGIQQRFKKRLINMIEKKGTRYNDYTVSPKIRQLLLQWAVEVKRKN